MFDNKKEIEPYMEDERGPTFEFCKEMAIKYKTFVAAGYARLQSIHYFFFISFSISFISFSIYYLLQIYHLLLLILY